MTTEHSDEDDHAELRTVVEEIDFDEFEGLYEDFYEDTVTNVQQIPQAVNAFQLVLWLCLFISFWQYTFTHLLVLLKSLQVLLEHEGRYSEVFAATAIAMPTSLCMYHKMIGISDLAYTKYVVCIKCYKLYKFDEYIETIGGVSRSKRCANILFPRHPHKQHRQKCGQLLLTQYTTASGKKMLYPWKTYCYLSV